MTEQFKSDDASMPRQAESDVLVLIKKMQQQLDFLEKKIDILISQSQEKPFREKSFQKPFRPYQPGGSYGHARRERSFDRDRPYEKRQGGGHQEFGGPKREYGGERENRPHQGHPFKKKFGGDKGGFDSKKKFFFNKRKG